MKNLFLLIIIFFVMSIINADIIEENYDLSCISDRLEAYIKLRTSLDGSDVIFYWSGNVYAMLPEERDILLFEIEGYNIARSVKVEGGYHFLSREMTVYKDPLSGEILDSWKNPLNSREVEVVHVWNDPVNHDWTEDRYLNILTEPVFLGDDGFWGIEVLLRYPSPLSREEFPLHSADDIYKSIEMFNFFFKRSDLYNKNLNSIPTLFSWTRIGQWLPFMEMGDREGYLVYHCKGLRLADGFDGLPSHIKKFVLENNEEYKNSPDNESIKDYNETSWTYFKNLYEERSKEH